MKLFAALLLVSLTLFQTSCDSWLLKKSTEQENENDSDNEVAVEKTPEQLRLELRAKEEEEPLEYLVGADLNMEPQYIQTRSAGFFHDAEYAPNGAMISGEITNYATLARFKDPKITLYFYSQTNTLIKKQSYVIYEYLDPGATTSFSFKIESYPESYDRFEYKIYDASVAGE